MTNELLLFTDTRVRHRTAYFWALLVLVAFPSILLADDPSVSSMKLRKELVDDLEGVRERCQRWSFDCATESFAATAETPADNIDQHIAKLIADQKEWGEHLVSKACRVAKDDAKFRIDDEFLSAGTIDRTWNAFDGKVLRTRSTNGYYANSPDLNYLNSETIGFPESQSFVATPVELLSLVLSRNVSHYVPLMQQTFPILSEGKFPAVQAAVKVSREKIDGLDCYRIDHVEHMGYSETVWLAVDRDLSLVRIDARTHNDDSPTTVVQRIQAVGFQTCSSGNESFWLPNQYISVYQNPGDEKIDRIHISPSNRHEAASTFRVVDQTEPALLAAKLKQVQANANSTFPAKTTGAAARPAMQWKRVQTGTQQRSRPYWVAFGAILVAVMIGALGWRRHRKQVSSQRDGSADSPSSVHQLMKMIRSVAGHLPFALILTALLWIPISEMPSSFRQIAGLLGGVVAVIVGIAVRGCANTEEAVRRTAIFATAFTVFVSSFWCLMQPSMIAGLAFCGSLGLLLWLAKGNAIAVRHVRLPRMVGARAKSAAVGTCLSGVVFAASCCVESWWEKGVATGMAGLFGLAWLLVTIAISRRATLMNLLCVCLCFAVLMSSYRSAADSIQRRKRMIDDVTMAGGTVGFDRDKSDFGLWTHTPEKLWIPSWLANSIGDAAKRKVASVTLPSDSFTASRVRRWNFDDLKKINIEAVSDQSARIPDITDAILAIPPSARLRDVSSEHSYIRDTGLERLSRIDDIRWLALNCKFGSPSREIANFDHLESLSLFDVECDNGALEMMSKLPDLGVLWFENVDYVATDVAARFSSSATYVGVSKSKVPASWAAWLSAMSVEDIRFYDCDIDAECFANAETIFKHAKSIQFSSTKVTPTDLMMLSDVKKLESIMLENSGLKKQTIESFTRSRPDVTINWRK